MKTYFVLADTHGFYKEMRAALKRSGFLAMNPEHIVILCGDMLDRGNGSLQCVKFFHKLLKAGRFIFIRGNHEDLFEDMVKRGYPNSYDYGNGTFKSFRQLYIKETVDPYVDPLINGMSFEDLDPRWKKLLDSAVDYYETPHHLFVHGWFPVHLSRDSWDLKKFSHSWESARWDNGMKLAMNGGNYILPDKTVVCGHWHTSYGNVRKLFPAKSEDSYKFYEFTDLVSPRRLMAIYRNTGIIALDACTSWSGFCNCLVLTEEEI